MSICIFYFSGTGNTWWASHRLAEELSIRGRTAEVHSIELMDENKTAKLIEESDTLIFGYPTYGSCIPEPMKRFIDKLPKPVKTKKSGIFCTQMKVSGDGAWYYHKVLEEKDYSVKWTYHFNLPNNIGFKVSPFRYTDDKLMFKSMFDKCLIDIKTAAEDIVGDVPSYIGNTIGGLLLGLMQRPVCKIMYKRPFKSFYKVDPEKCAKCMRCIQICPVGNIRLADGKIEFGDECALCLRCYNYCPATAILAYNHSHGEEFETYKGPEGFDPALITARKNLIDYME